MCAASAKKQVTPLKLQEMRRVNKENAANSRARKAGLLRASLSQLTASFRRAFLLDQVLGSYDSYLYLSIDFLPGSIPRQG